jgi:hypothetical protein
MLVQQKFHWPTSRHLNNEGQEWKIGHAKGRALLRGVKEGSKEREYGWSTFYKRMNIEHLICWNHQKKRTKVERRETE